MERLPIEILVKILSNPARTTTEEVINVSSTCKNLDYTLKRCQLLWKDRFAQTWPRIFRKFQEQITDYYHETKHIYELKKRITVLLRAMPAKFYNNAELSDSALKDWYDLHDEQERNYYYLINILLEFYHQDAKINSIRVVPLDTPGHLTVKYYAYKALEHLHRFHLTAELRAFLALPPALRLLEEGATAVAQWYQPDVWVDRLEVGDQLNAFADLVLERLRVLSPELGLLSASPHVLLRLRSEVPDCHQWPLEECSKIYDVLRTVLYERLKFAVPEHGHYYNINNSLLNRVLETRRGLPVTLAIVVQAVGRRLGLHLEPINSEQQFLLRFGDGASGVYYIDLQDGMLVEAERPNEPQHAVQFPVADARDVLERILYNWVYLSGCLERSRTTDETSTDRPTLELLHVLGANDYFSLCLWLYHLEHDLDGSHLCDFFKNKVFKKSSNMDFSQSLKIKQDKYYQMNKVTVESLFPKAVKTRRQELKFAIGMVMKYVGVKNGGRETYGVIYGWNCDYCNWIKYNILNEKGYYEEIEQELLQILPDPQEERLFNVNVGRFFSHFFINHYVPNAELEAEYPNDAEVRFSFYKDMDLYQRLVSVGNTSQF